MAAAAAEFVGHIRERPAAVGRETWPTGSSGGGAPPWLARVAGGWPVAPPTAQNPTARKWVKTTKFGVHDLGEFFLWFCSSK